jgi:thymidylate synthase
MGFEREYHGLIERILTFGQETETRNSVTTKVFGEQIKLRNIANYFPLITGRKMFPDGIIGEMAAFLRGPKTLKDFTDNGCNYWLQWAKPDGSINVDYGNKWRDFDGVDQLTDVILSIKQNPFSRRHIINAWDPKAIKDLDLPCCHYCYQFDVTPDGKLNLVWIQRSVDVMIGLPSDFVLAAVMLILIAAETGLVPGDITMQMGDCHIYQDHIDNAIQYLNRPILVPPAWQLSEFAEVDTFKLSDLLITDYRHGPKLPFKLIS